MKANIVCWQTIIVYLLLALEQAGLLNSILLNFNPVLLIYSLHFNLIVLPNEAATQNNAFKSRAITFLGYRLIPPDSSVWAEPT